MRKIKLMVAALAAGGVLVLTAGPAVAHVFIEETEAPAGGYALLTLEVPHGCEDSPTTAVAVQLPEGTLSVVPENKPGWDAVVEQETLDEPIEEEHGDAVTEVPSTVTWTATGDPLPADQLARFAMSVQVPDGEAGDTIFFPTVQTCEEGETAWIEEWDGEGEEPEAPAPSVVLVAAEDEHGSTDSADEEHADEEASTDEAAAASDSATQDDVDSAQTLATVGLLVGAAGLVVAIVALVKGRKPAA